MERFRNARLTSAKLALYKKKRPYILMYSWLKKFLKFLPVQYLRLYKMTIQHQFPPLNRIFLILHYPIPWRNNIELRPIWGPARDKLNSFLNLSRSRTKAQSSTNSGNVTIFCSNFQWYFLWMVYICYTENNQNNAHWIV